ncbi:MAG: MerR family transcriptional regulator [Actinomycetota bacterium]
MRYRVEQLAAACEVSVDTVRYYQSRGLLPPPEREGRVAWYGPEHADRIRQVRWLQKKGLTLAAIRRVVTGELGPADADLAAAVAVARDAGGVSESDDDAELLDLEAFSARSGVPASLIQAVEREGIRFGRTVGGEPRYTTADIEMVRTALKLLEFGLPLGDLLALARSADDAMRGLAERAVELFDESVRKPIRDTASSDDAAAEHLVEAFRSLLPAVTELVARHFRRVLLETALAHIEKVGDAAEVEATRAESLRLERSP